MIIFKQKKIKLANKDATTSRNPDITEKNTATRKFHIQLKRSKDFNICINSMNSISSYTNDEERLIQLIQQSSNTIKDAFLHIGGKLAELTN